MLAQDPDKENFEIREGQSWIAGFYDKKEKKIYILGIWSKRKGFMKENITKLCKKYKTNNVEFAHVISFQLLQKLKNAKPKIFETELGIIINLEVIWEVDQDEG